MMKLDELYNLYFQDIYRFLVSLTRDPYTAEDLLQETFYKAHLHLESYHEGSVKSWLFTVARNVFIDHYRKQKREIVKERSFFARIFDRKIAVEDHVVVSEELDDLLKILEELPTKQRIAVVLRDFHEVTYDEGAAMMGVASDSVGVEVDRERRADAHMR